MLNHLRTQKEMSIATLAGLVSNVLSMKTIDDRFAEEMPVITIETKRYRVSNFKR